MSWFLTFIDLDPLYQSFKDLRKRYKAFKEEGEAMQTTRKLIGNAGYGKLLQRKEVLDPNYDTK
jgi:hypothetical protein